MSEQRTCLHCGEKFDPKHDHQHTCKQECTNHVHGHLLMEEEDNGDDQ